MTAARWTAHDIARARRDAPAALLAAASRSPEEVARASHERVATHEAGHVVRFLGAYGSPSYTWVTATPAFGFCTDDPRGAPGGDARELVLESWDANSAAIERAADEFHGTEREHFLANATDIALAGAAAVAAMTDDARPWDSVDDLHGLRAAALLVGEDRALDYCERRYQAVRRTFTAGPLRRALAKATAHLTAHVRVSGAELEALLEPEVGTLFGAWPAPRP